MAYRLKVSEPFEAGVRRIGLQQIDRALGQLQSNQAIAVGVHATRKGLKRIRALLRLARPALGDAVYKHENERYRDLARHLSAQRDEVVVMETVSTFETAATGRTKTAFAMARARLAKPDIEHPAQNSAVAHAITGLVEGRTHMAGLIIPGRDYACAWEGLERAYRQAERAFETATQTRDNEDVHIWRKRVQYHWRHVMLLSAAWPEEMAVRIATARQLSAILGQDHDIAMMLTELAGDGPTEIPAQMTAHQRKLAEAFARERQSALRREAHQLTQRLFAEGASAFRRRIETYWIATSASCDKAED